MYLCVHGVHKQACVCKTVVDTADLDPKSAKEGSADSSKL